MAYERKYTDADLKIMQAWPLERKIQVSQTRIIEWYQRNNGNVYVAFSGGKDSTVLLDLVRRVYPDVPAVFVDTGLEYPELREFIKTIPNVTWLKPGMNFRKVIETYGYPIVSKSTAEVIEYGKKPGTYRWKRLQGAIIREDGNPSKYNCEKWAFLLDAPFKVSAKCCTVMKKKPFHVYEKETGRVPFIATMACESANRKSSWMKNGCNSFNEKSPKSQPIAFWTQQDVLDYLVQSKIPYADVYGDIIMDPDTNQLYTTGCDRTGCLFCGFGCHLEKEPNRFQKLKETHPKIWEYCMKPWDEHGLGMREVLEYIGVKPE